jgi:hypothetical protein
VQNSKPCRNAGEHQERLSWSLKIGGFDNGIETTRKDKRSAAPDGEARRNRRPIVISLVFIWLPESLISTVCIALPKDEQNKASDRHLISSQMDIRLIHVSVHLKRRLRKGEEQPCRQHAKHHHSPKEGIVIEVASRHGDD